MTTLSLITLIIVGLIFIIPSTIGLLKRGKTEKPLQLEELMRLLESSIERGTDKDCHGKLTPAFIDMCHNIHVLTWENDAVKRKSMSQRIRKYGYMEAINLRPIYMNQIRIGKKQK